jgi:hypothetical protein
MSTLGDFLKVWERRFPGSDLPSDWEDDVRVNLSKHRQKVRSLEEELDKEKTYVEYLERLLRERHEQNGSDRSPTDDNGEPSSCSEDAALKIISELSQTLANIENGAVGDDEPILRQKNAESHKPRAVSDVSNYVTVIEVNEGDNRALKKAHSVVEAEKPKKVPPKPPPKTFQLRRDGSDVSVNQLVDRKAEGEAKAAGGFFPLLFVRN